MSQANMHLRNDESRREMEGQMLCESNDQNGEEKEERERKVAKVLSAKVRPAEA